MSSFNKMENFRGFKVKRDVYTESGVLLLPAQTLLTEKQIKCLKQHKISLSSDYVERVGNRSKELIESALAEVKDIFEVAKQTGRIPIEEVQKELVPQIERLAETPRLLPFLMELQEVDDYTYRHNVAVGVISTLIGKWLGFDENSLKLLTLSASLHDIGKAKIPADILNKPGNLTPDEFSIMKNHTIIGFDILRKTFGSTPASYVALQHHEREDGSGYPFGLTSSHIDPLSKIVAVADVFHAMASKRVYKDPVPFHFVLIELRNNSFGLLDPDIVRTFVHKVMNSLIGCMVSLSDGRQGVIVMIHNENPLRPLVKIDEEFIDLISNEQINVESIFNKSINH